MQRFAATVVLTALSATPLVAQDRWETFQNRLTERQGAFMCSEFDADTGAFFCMELACDLGGDLTLELARDGGTVEPIVEAAFTINGVSMGSFEFEQVNPTGYTAYTSRTAAQDQTLRYWLSAGRSVEVTVGKEVQELSLAGSSDALREVLAVCPV